MFNFKALAATALIATTSIFAAPHAEAQTCFRVPSTDGVICNTYQGTNRYGAVYTLGYTTDTASTGMTVTCRGSHVVDWQSTGNMSYSYLNTLANYFCGL
jgi:hypothetical protein